MSKRKTTTRKKGARRCASFYKTAQELKEFFDNCPVETDEETTLRLTEMAGWMIRHTPEGGQLAEDIYRAIGRAWDAARNEYGYVNMTDPTEREIVRLHSELLDEFLRDRDPAAWREKHGISEVEESQPAGLPSQDAPTDINLWRQSHPRTIKRCIVEVEGGA